MGASKTKQYSKEIMLISEINNAISHPARLTIVEALTEKPGLRPKDLETIVELSHSATSEHLYHLKQAGLIRYEYVTHNYQVFLNEKNFSRSSRFLKKVEKSKGL